MEEPTIAVSSVGRHRRPVCRAEGVSPAAFYQWKRKLDDRSSHKRHQTAPPFVPIQLVDDDVKGDNDVVQIQLPNGAVVRVPEQPKDQVDVFLIDEIGKMECFSKLFVDVTRELFSGDVPVLATVALKGADLSARRRSATTLN